MAMIVPKAELQSERKGKKYSNCFWPPVNCCLRANWTMKEPFNRNLGSMVSGRFFYRILCFKKLFNLELCNVFDTSRMIWEWMLNHSQLN